MTSIADAVDEPTRFREFAARAVRAWRIALVSYLVPVSVATHWPRLGFGGGGIIDKFVHFLAFGTLAWLWMHAKPWGRASIGFAFAAAWVFVDEWTQSFEFLGRTFSAYDMIAGWVGVAMCGALYAAIRYRCPAQSAARADAWAIDDTTYMRGRNWAIAAAQTVFVVITGGGVLAYMQYSREGALYLGTFVYAIAFAGLIGAAIATSAVTSIGRRQFEQAMSRRAVVVAVPRWAPFVLALPFLVALGFAFRVFVAAIFGAPVSEDLATDLEGFRVLGNSGFPIGAALLSLAVGDLIAVRLRARRDPSLAERR